MDRGGISNPPHHWWVINIIITIHIKAMSALCFRRISSQERKRWLLIYESPLPTISLLQIRWKNKNGQDSWIKVGLNFRMKSNLLWLDIFRRKKNRKVKSKVVTCLLFLIIDQWSITARGFSIPIHQFAPEWTRWSISRFWVCLFPKQLGVLGAFVYISDLLGIILTFVSCVFSIFIASCQHLVINWLQFHNTRH